MIAAVAVCFVALTMIVRQFASGGPGISPIGGLAYFYDLSTHELFAEENTHFSPFAAPSGGQAVRALVFSCGDCAVEADRHIGHLQRFTDDALSQLHDAGGNVTSELLVEMSDTGLLVALPPESNGEPQWIAIDQPQAVDIMERHLTACGETPLTVCSP